LELLPPIIENFPTKRRYYEPYHETVCGTLLITGPASGNRLLCRNYLAVAMQNIRWFWRPRCFKGDVLTWNRSSSSCGKHPNMVLTGLCISWWCFWLCLKMDSLLMTPSSPSIGLFYNLNINLYT